MKRQTIYVFGEVLFDCFEDGRAVLGGAPFNVAWHLRGFGLNPIFVSAVGRDSRGEQILESMQRWKMDTAALKVLKEKPTGEVRVRLDSSGVPTYTIQDDVAYDHLSWDIVPEDGSLVYHGTLAMRHAENLEQIQKLKQNGSIQTFVDANLRPPWWERATLPDILRGVTWLKLNHEELPSVSHALGCSSDTLAEQSRHVMERLRLERLIVTHGAQGAELLEANGVRHWLDAQPPKMMADTVGAGDAFSAVVLYGLYCGWKSGTILARAIGFASRVCSLSGAVTEEKAFYETIMHTWTQEGVMA